MADLVTTITEAVTINGKERGSSNQKTISSINNVYHRIVTLADDLENATLVAFTSTIQNRDGALDRDKVKYIRVTNLDTSNKPVILNLQQRVNEDASSAGDANAGILLEASQSFILGGAKEMIDVAAGANDIDILSNLHDLESIMVDPLSEAVKVEIFIASE